MMIAALDAWFDRIAGAVHAFGGKMLKFIGDGVLAIFPVTGAPAEACGRRIEDQIRLEAALLIFGVQAGPKDCEDPLGDP
jgi:adenylate cyclase